MWRRTRIIGWGFLLAVILAGPGRADGAELPDGAVLVGAARIDITPDYPVRLAGYAGRMEEATEVVQRLWGKALAIGDDGGEGPALLILAENCSATSELASELADRLAAKAGIRPQRCVVLSTHTHSAPLLPEFAPWHYTTAMSSEHLAHMQRYRRELADRLEQVAVWTPWPLANLVFSPGTRVRPASAPTGVCWRTANGLDFCPPRQPSRQVRWTTVCPCCV